MDNDKNMELWDQVCKTDPDHTKTVSQRGGFTAIDAHYQIQRATEVLGPVGEGWSYSTEYSETHLQDGYTLVNCDLTFFWTLGKALHSFGPIRGCSILAQPDRRPDTDAPKKAMTDALTKSLSHLGFNADVFLGKFDDNKYVQGLIDEKAARSAFSSVTKRSTTRNKLIKAAEDGDDAEVQKIREGMDNDQKAEMMGLLSKPQKILIKESLDRMNENE